jgi:2-amino-4-hydroxy-6-hydroxymethyldihydropteridine diphosphokinase
MATIYLGLGSNIDALANLRLALEALHGCFEVVRESSVYSSKSVGFDGDDFLNLAMEASTTMPPHEVVDELEKIHALAGRKRSGKRFASRELDIDLLLYDALILDSATLKLPRADVLDYGFVLLPLCEIAPDLVHPVSGRTLADHLLELPGLARDVRKTGITL